MLRGICRVSMVSLLFLACQATQTLAGVTGSITGTVDQPDGSPLADAHAAVTSPSQSANTMTDTRGHYAFLTLAPDTYSVTISKEGYDPVQQVGVTVLADQVQTVNFIARRSVATLGRVTVSAAVSPLVSRSQVSNVYAVNAQRLPVLQALGGGNNLENAYSVLDSVPGIFHSIGNSGWGQTLFIHGGNYTEVGYEYDGVPVNRAFDQYNGDTFSSLGNQQVQVYTGGAPASSSSSTVAGFINQVIKTGTYPGFASLSTSLGAPSLWNGEKIEVGGATPDRRFSYYVGNSNYAEDLRYYDQFNGGLSVGPISLPSVYKTGTFFSAGTIPYCTPSGADPTPAKLPDAGCYVNGVPLAVGTIITPSNIFDHETVANMHFAVPHPKDGNHDDLQVLYSASYLLSKDYGSTADLGGGANIANLTNGFFGAQPPYTDGVTWPDGTQFGQTVKFVPGGGPCQLCAGGLNNSNLPVTTYLYPSSNLNRQPFAPIPFDARDGVGIDDYITKLQYTHNMGANAYVRAYAYTLYSDWLQNGPQNALYVYQGFGQLATGIQAPDYELSSHTRGGELQFGDQLNDHNLLQLTANLTSSTPLRFNNKEMFNHPGTAATVLTDSHGNCYDATTGAVTFCYDPAAQGSFENPTPNNGTIVGAAAAAGAAWHVSFLGPTGTYNTVKPTFSSYSISDELKATDKLLFNFGVRYERFQYDLASANSPDNNFWFHAAAESFCYDPANGQPVTQPLAPLQAPPAPPFEGLNCPASPITGRPTVHPDGMNGHLLFTNQISGPIVADEILPRFGGTYTLSPDTVIRFNYGRYAQPVETAFTEYLFAPGAGQAAAAFNFSNFWGFGFNTPRHDLSPVVSNNYDISFEQQFPHDIAMRLTPFFRSSQGEYANILIGPNFASGYPYANEFVQGVELQTNFADPLRNGLSGQLAFTYTNAYVHLLDNPQGKNGVDFLNSLIDGYNALTKTGNVEGLKGAPCYDAGVAAPGECIVSGNTITLGPGATSSTIINPYYFGAAQANLDRNGSYAPYQAFPSNYFGPTPFTTNLWPYQFSGFVSYKHNIFTITPTFQLQSGNNYGGTPYILGYDPRTCAQNQGAAGITTGNPGKANFVSCGPSAVTDGLLSIPNPNTGKFDTPGQYREPWVLSLSAQLSADISRTITARLVASNVLNTCFGGSKTAWSSEFPPGRQVCAYLPNSLYVSNFWNGTGPLDAKSNAAPPVPANASAYAPAANPFNPFQLTFQLQFKT